MWIKVCGIRDRQTAREVAQSEIDAIGLNFYANSPRFVTTDEAMEISNLLPVRIERVGVFVNHSILEIERIAQSCRLNAVQLHGDESLSFAAELQQRLPETRLIRAWRMSTEGLAGLARYLDEAEVQKIRFAGCLVDAHVANVFGGSGKTVDWNLLSQEYRQEDWPPLILAGGLHPGNVAEAIRMIKPWGIDVASGVESSPGVKDLERLRQFVANARFAAKK